MGILTYLKLGAAAAVLLALGYLVWNYHHMQTTIGFLKDQNATLILGQQITNENIASLKKFMTARSAAIRKVTNEQEEIRQSEAAGDDSDLDRRLGRYWLQPADQSGGAAPGRAGGAQHPAP
ncbi:MAG: hypothetical protein M1438_09595 [Deltaproteobacteria bacterium]|nr:hypothetical protein [Deltaproteobacteria bacterium]